MPKACRGGYRFGNRVWRCWDEKGHGFLDVLSAFTQSCDVYYYQAGLQLGMDRINSMARRFGLGSESGIDLDDERAGLLMDSALYTARFRKRGWRWSRGLILNLSIGQGQIVTPLQLANYAAGMAHGRVVYRPRLLREVRDAEGFVTLRGQPQVLKEVGLSPDEHAAILKAMEMVVNSPKGTGGRARMSDILVGGKTGSAENPHGEKTHALFICAAPLDNPRIVVAVVLENVGHGGSMAAPIAGALLKRFFGRDARG
jgi:penicillin-binding protein 2